MIGFAILFVKMVLKKLSFEQSKSVEITKTKDDTSKFARSSVNSSINEMPPAVFRAFFKPNTVDDHMIEYAVWRRRPKIPFQEINYLRMSLGPVGLNCFDSYSGGTYEYTGCTPRNE